MTRSIALSKPCGAIPCYYRPITASSVTGTESPWTIIERQSPTLLQKRLEPTEFQGRLRLLSHPREPARILGSTMCPVLVGFKLGNPASQNLFPVRIDIVRRQGRHLVGAAQADTK